MGLAIGVVGTLIGAGGGFLLVPLLLLVEPQWNAEVVTGFSIAVVAANATTGAFSYWRLRRIDLLGFPVFAAAALPGAVAGVFVTALLPRHLFDLLFGGVLTTIGLLLAVRPPHASVGARTGRGLRRVLTDRTGTTYRWTYDLRIGAAGAAGVGFVSSLLGIGGGIVHVPFLAAVLGFPEHVATATSHAVLAVTALVATVVHLVHGDYRSDGTLVVATAVGAVAGAPLGARLSTRVPGPVLLRILGVCLGFVGVRLLLS